MTSPLYDYQGRAIRWMMERSSGYLAVDMGLGKTRIVLEYIRRTAHGRKVFVVAPLRVAISTWPSEINKWAPGLSYVVLHGVNKELLFQKDVDIYIVNYEGLKWLSGMFHKYGRARFLKGIMILDEATMVKSQSSGRFKYLKAMRSIFEYAFALSATPAPNGYQDLWSQYFLLDYGKTLGAGYTAFFNRYFLVLDSRRVVPVSKERLKEIPQRIAGSTFRLDGKDYLQLPEFIDNHLFVDLGPKLMAKYRELEREFCIALADEATVTAVNTAMLSMKLRQFCQGALYADGEGRQAQYIHTAKVALLQDIIGELQGEPTLVAIQFRFEAQALLQAFPGTPIIYGGVSGEKSAEIINQWNAGKLPILICHPASLSHGVNLQAGGHYITWLAQTWNLEQYQQFNGRLRRHGQKNRVVRNHVLIRGSIEERMLSALNTKNVNQQALLDTLRQFTQEILA